MATAIPIDAHEAANLASYHAERDRLDGILLRTQRQKIRIACRIGDARKRNRALYLIATDLTCHPWRPGDVRDAALNLAAAIDDVTMRAMPLADLVAVVGADAGSTGMEH